MIKYPAPLLIRFLQVLTANAIPPRILMGTTEPRKPTVKRPGRNLLHMDPPSLHKSRIWGLFSAASRWHFRTEHVEVALIWSIDPVPVIKICSNLSAMDLERNNSGRTQVAVGAIHSPQPSLQCLWNTKEKNRFALSGGKSRTALNGK